MAINYKQFETQSGFKHLSQNLIKKDVKSIKHVAT